MGGRAAVPSPPFLIAGDVSPNRSELFLGFKSRNKPCSFCSPCSVPALLGLLGGGPTVTPGCGRGQRSPPGTQSVSQGAGKDRGRLRAPSCLQISAKLYWSFVSGRAAPLVPSPWWQQDTVPPGMESGWQWGTEESREGSQPWGDAGSCPCLEPRPLSPELPPCLRCWRPGSALPAPLPSCFTCS